MNADNIFSKDIAIDMGSCYTRIIIAGEGICLYEPTVMARDIHTGEIIAVGSEARDMDGKCPKGIKVIRPISDGTVSDFKNTAALLKVFLNRVCKKSIIKPRVVITVPCLLTDVEKRAVIDMSEAAGARKTFLIESTLAASLGANCDISLARGMLTAHIGGGRCDISSISVGHPVINRSIKTAGNSFTEATIKYIKDRYDTNIGWVTAEKLKEEIGCVYSLDIAKSHRIYGCDATTGMPRSITVSSEELKDAYEDVLAPIIAELKAALEDTPPELLGDILEDGILLTGGGAAMYGIDRRIRMSLGIKVFLAENIDMCAVMGAGYELAKLKNSSFKLPSVNPLKM